MQRQSLGSPGSKLHLAGTPSDSDDDDKKRRRSRSASFSSPPSPSSHPVDDPDKPLRTVHVIPLLTLLCFLVLYLFSHDPSPKDLVGFGIRDTGFDSQESGVASWIGTEVRSNRRLKEIRSRKLTGGRRR